MSAHLSGIVELLSADAPAPFGSTSPVLGTTDGRRSPVLSERSSDLGGGSSKPGSPRPPPLKALAQPLLERAEEGHIGPAPATTSADGGGGEEESRSVAVTKALIYGCINAVVCAPVMISFASIIFRHPTFHRDAATYARLVKLVLFSSAVHQTVFVTTSSLVFAVGQVQDAGLIFLSSMANQVVEALEKRQAPYDEVIATALVALASSTTLLGLALVLTGKLRLAGLVQYLPLPVVGGYLAYIGLYCFEAGLSLMSGTEVTSVAQMAEQPASCLETWSSFRPSLVHWDVLPSLLPTWLAMYTVVAFSSSLDVAAIQMDMGKQLDFNHELITVGLSNAASGLCGGFTGSYIFSTTIFTYRTGTRLRLCGAVVIAAELLLFASPVTVGAYVPKLFFGAVLTFIAADLLVDWLWAARHKVHPTEYAIILLTFGAINCFGLEVGMCGGVLIAMCHFIIDYASAPVVRRIDVRSTVLRSFAHSRALAGEQTRLISLRCRGYIFFGSTLRIMEDVLSAVSVPPHLEPTLGRPPSKQRPSAQPAPPTRFVLFDFAAVTGLDATAARACFLNLTRTLAPLGIEALEYCEEKLLEEATRKQPIGTREFDSSPFVARAATQSAPDLAHLAALAGEPGGGEENSQRRQRGQLAGEVELWEERASGKRGADREQVRIARYAHGGIFGELDFFLHNRRSFRAEAGGGGTSLLTLTRGRLRDMQSEAPHLAAALEHALLRYLCFQVNAKLGLVDGVSDVTDPFARASQPLSTRANPP
ncbi:hypothetical protein EMIHUDRAFT_460215 [Emiliania huxleyi CCMP1516]|uniref:Cyclic nucleotide-binding domain-containing protein n=2 Tax=Emiliania huxleyi TaxID=2903 RepID=A0A0D3I0Y1_EMIH1|nr:hypothetical protein EMIHUDRAFT_460215 [Emiliania huxleyi CCMP1516]EOD04916.1 hypothetical protein EMIHUDRAFT_460215 [Emiliania huxleyi CCMP1516]|eukprot:XP_005757345.1 hypothetical protein EMIHUDRAFT_460215 [Emiliania huxleyi CCMP1516]